MLIRLTDQSSGRPLFINPAAIVSVVPLPGETEGTRLPERTRVACGNGESVIVLEPLGQVEALTRRRPDDGLLNALEAARREQNEQALKDGVELAKLADRLKQAEAERDGLINLLLCHDQSVSDAGRWIHPFSGEYFDTRAAAVADLLERARGGRA